MTIMMQKPGSDNLYVSDLIDGRFQVLESSTFRNYFYIYDHSKDATVNGSDGTMYFTASADALAHLAGAPAPVKAAKAPKPAKAPKLAKAEKEPRKAHAITTGKVEVRERKERAGSMLAVIRGLLRKGGDDKSVFMEYKTLYPVSPHSLKTVANLRKEMGLA